MLCAVRPWGYKNAPMGVFFYPHGRVLVKIYLCALKDISLQLKRYNLEG